MTDHALLDLPLRPEVKELLNRADKWWFCPSCRYVARDFPWPRGIPRDEIEFEDAYPPCQCGESCWTSVSGLSREERWAFVCSEIPNAVIAALAKEDTDE